MPASRRDFLSALTLGAAAAALAPAARAALPAPKRLCFREGKPFRIMQITDTHYIPPTGKDKRCQQVDDMLEMALTQDKPDLVIHTGDCVTNTFMETGWDRFAALFNKHGVPFAAVMGNHDHEGRHSRKEIVSYVAGLEGSLTQTGPADIPGYGNYTIPLYAPDGTSVRTVLYCLDSRAYAKDTALKDVKGIGKYAWFAPTQIDWLREQAAAYRKANGGRPVPGAFFFHIPLPEYNQAWSAPDDKQRAGSKNEAVCCPAVNSGMFYAMLETQAALCAFCGHDHDNDYIGRVHGMGLAYGRFSGGTNTYQHWENGVRLIDLAPDGRSLRTRTHLKSGKYSDWVAFGLD